MWGDVVKSKLYFRVSEGEYCVRLEDGREFCSDRVTEVRRVASEMVEEAVRDKKSLELEAYGYSVGLIPVLDDVWKVDYYRGYYESYGAHTKVLVRSDQLPEIVSKFFTDTANFEYDVETEIAKGDVSACGLWNITKLFDKPTKDNNLILEIWDQDSPNEYYLVGDRKLTDELKQAVIDYLEDRMVGDSFYEYEDEIKAALNRSDTLGEFVRWLASEEKIVSNLPGC